MTRKKTQPVCSHFYNYLQSRYYGGIRLIEAIIVRFKDYCDKKGIQLEDKNFTLEYGSTIPFGVGLGGSIAIIRAVFSSLMRFYLLQYILYLIRSYFKFKEENI